MFLVDANVWLELLLEQERAGDVPRCPGVTEAQAALIARARDSVRGAELLARDGLS